MESSIDFRGLAVVLLLVVVAAAGDLTVSARPGSAVPTIEPATPASATEVPATKVPQSPLAPLEVRDIPDISAAKGDETPIPSPAAKAYQRYDQGIVNSTNAQILTGPLQGVVYDQGEFRFRVLELLRDEANGLGLRVEAVNDTDITQYLHYPRDEPPELFGQSRTRYVAQNVAQDTLPVEPGEVYEGVWYFGHLRGVTYAVRLGVNLHRGFGVRDLAAEEPSFYTSIFDVRGVPGRQGRAENRYVITDGNLTVELRRVEVDRSGVALHLSAFNEGKAERYDLFWQNPALTEGDKRYLLDAFSYRGCTEGLSDMRSIPEGERRSCTLIFRPVPPEGAKLHLCLHPAANRRAVEPITLDFVAP